MNANTDINIETIRTDLAKSLNIAFPQNDAYGFLVDTIGNAETLSKLMPMIKSSSAGNIDALTIGKRKIRIADDTSGNPTGVTGITKRQIAYAVKKVFWDEWIKNDDVFYNAVREANNIATQTGISNTTDLETLIIQMLQKQFAMDLQDLAFNGDTTDTSGDAAFLTILDGFVKKMKTSTNETDLGAAALTLTQFVNHVQLLPEEYKNNFADDIAWFITRKVHDKLMALVSARATGYGDAVMQDGKITKLAGYDIEIVASMQSGFVALTPRKNLVPIMTMDVKYTRTGDGAEAAKRDSTYHIIHAYLDVIVKEVNAVAYMIGDNL